MYNPPNKILIKSDTNIIEYSKTIKKSINNKEELYVYKFIKSETKKDKECMFTEEGLRKQLNNYFKEI